MQPATVQHMPHSVAHVSNKAELGVPHSVQRKRRGQRSKLWEEQGDLRTCAPRVLLTLPHTQQELQEPAFSHWRGNGRQKLEGRPRVGRSPSQLANQHLPQILPSGHFGGGETSTGPVRSQSRRQCGSPEPHSHRFTQAGWQHTTRRGETCLHQVRAGRRPARSPNWVDHVLRLRRRSDSREGLWFR